MESQNGNPPAAKWRQSVQFPEKKAFAKTRTNTWNVFPFMQQIRLVFILKEVNFYHLLISCSGSLLIRSKTFCNVPTNVVMVNSYVSYKRIGIQISVLLSKEWKHLIFRAILSHFLYIFNNAISGHKCQPKSWQSFLYVY